MPLRSHPLLNHSDTPAPKQIPTKKERVVAIDYLRGLAMIAVMTDHFQVFSSPLVYITGRGILWTSAAEMFFLLSGVTLGIVRGKIIRSQFNRVLQMSWRRALKLYVTTLIVAAISLAVSYALLTAKVSFQPPGQIPPASQLAAIMAPFLTLRYSFGWADFLIYYSVYMLAAPFVLRILHSRWWILAPTVSLLLYASTALPFMRHNPYLYFFIWQAYFVIGITLARHRIAILSWFYGLRRRWLQLLAGTIVTLAALITAASAYLMFNIGFLQRLITKSTAITPVFQDIANILERNRDTLYWWLQNNRSGLLRPVVTLIIFATGYILYQWFKPWLLRYTGWFVNPIGSNSLYVFIVQALIFPPLSALPLPHHNIILNCVLWLLIFTLVWLMIRQRFLFRVIPR